MLSFSALLFGLLLTGFECGQHLPSWFKLGAASSAFQIEGGWNVSDKGESVWDRQLREYPETAEGNIEVACASYYKWQRDIEMCGQLGLDVYRFSISWPRILPNGLTNHISVDGIKYYNDLIDGLIAKGIEPVVTLYHFDLPQRLQDLGGWANPLIVDWFAEYSRVAFTNFGDRVKFWLTINEPLVVCDIGYSNNSVPYLNDSKYGAYLCNKNVLLAHAKAYRVYEKEFKSVYNGKLSIVSLVMWLKPKTKYDEEITALAREFMGSRFEYPIYSKEGGWPKKIDAFLNKQNIKEGSSTPRLIPFTDEETVLIKGTADFYALNHYTTRLVRKAVPGEVIGAWPQYGSDQLGVVFETDPSWETGDDSWFGVYPEGLREQLTWFRKQYDIEEYMITENGFLSSNDSLHDTRTINYHKGYLEQVVLAIQDGINVTGYTVWALMDNWERGYTTKFGLYSVNFDDENRTRTMRESGKYYSKVSKTRWTDPENI